MKGASTWVSPNLCSLWFHAWEEFRGKTVCSLWESFAEGDLSIL
jgi:hypothetical protein